jgi:hypothetical protein
VTQPSRLGCIVHDAPLKNGVISISQHLERDFSGSSTTKLADCRMEGGRRIPAARGAQEIIIKPAPLKQLMQSR